jgi:hypothetical protein
MEYQRNLHADEKYNPVRAANYREVNRPFNYVQNALSYGILGGIVLGAYQCLIGGADGTINIGMELLGFLLLTPFLLLALRKFRNYHAGGEIFKMGIIHGMSISAVASLLMAVIATIGMAWFVPQDMMLEKLDIGEIVVNSSFQILVGIVFGMTITFIILQGLKSDMRADKNIENMHS